jgi:hypothetical protein
MTRTELLAAADVESGGAATTLLIAASVEMSALFT